MWNAFWPCPRAISGRGRGRGGAGLWSKGAGLGGGQTDGVQLTATAHSQLANQPTGQNDQPSDVDAFCGLQSLWPQMITDHECPFAQ